MLPAVCSCVSVLLCVLATRSSIAPASSAAMCQRAFCSLTRAWLAIFCGSYARTLRQRYLHCSTAHDVNLLRVFRPYKAGIHHPAQPDETGIFSPRVQAYVQRSGALILQRNNGFQASGDQPSSRHHAVFCAVNLRRPKAAATRSDSSDAAQLPLLQSCKKERQPARCSSITASLQQQHN